MPRERVPGELTKRRDSWNSAWETRVLRHLLVVAGTGDGRRGVRLVGAEGDVDEPVARARPDVAAQAEPVGSRRGPRGRGAPERGQHRAALADAATLGGTADVGRGARVEPA